MPIKLHDKIVQRVAELGEKCSSELHALRVATFHDTEHKVRAFVAREVEIALRAREKGEKVDTFDGVIALCGVAFSSSARDAYAAGKVLRSRGETA